MEIDRTYSVGRETKVEEELRLAKVLAARAPITLEHFSGSDDLRTALALEYDVPPNTITNAVIRGSNEGIIGSYTTAKPTMQHAVGSRILQILPVKIDA